MSTFPSSYFARAYFSASYFSAHFGPLDTAYRVDLPGIGPAVVFGPATVTPGPVLISLPGLQGTLGSPTLGYVLAVPSLQVQTSLGEFTVSLADGSIVTMAPIAPLDLGDPLLTDVPSGSFFPFFW